MKRLRFAGGTCFNSERGRRETGTLLDNFLGFGLLATSGAGAAGVVKKAASSSVNVHSNEEKSSGGGVGALGVGGSLCIC